MKISRKKTTIFVGSLIGLLVSFKVFAASLVEYAILVALVVIVATGSYDLDKFQTVNGNITSCNGENLPFNGTLHTTVSGNSNGKILLHTNFKAEGISEETADSFILKGNEYFKIDIPDSGSLLADDLTLTMQSNDRIIFKGNRSNEKLFFMIDLRFTLNDSGQPVLIIDRFKLQGGCL